MVMVAYQRAGCELRLGPSQAHLDWDPVPSGADPVPALDAEPPPGHVPSAVLLSSWIQSLAVVLMLVVSVGVGAVAGAAHAMHDHGVEGRTVALAQGPGSRVTR